MSAPTSSTKKVLYIEAGSDFRAQVQKWTEGLDHFELVASPPIETLAESPPEGLDPCLVLLDGRRSPQECLEWAQTLKMAFKSPLIIFYDGRTELNFADLKKNGANALMHFYYDSEFAIDKILELAPWEGEGPPPLSVLNPIAFDDLSSEMDLNFDLYVHLPGNQKSILVRKKGSAADERLIGKAKDCKQNLYFKKSELKQFLEYSRTALSLKNSDLAMSVTDKTMKARESIQQIISHFFDRESKDFAGGRVILENCEKIVQEFGLKDWKNKNEALEAITIFSGRPRTFYNDVITLCVLSAGFGFLLDKKKEEVIDLALAGLLHNVGLAYMERPVLDGTAISEADKKDFMGYPERSVNQVKTKKVPLSQRVTDLILQHREHSSGGGFPKGTNNEHHDPSARIIQLAFQVMEMTQLQGSQPRHTLSGAFQQLQDQMMSTESKVDGATLLALKKHFKP